MCKGCVMIVNFKLNVKFIVVFCVKFLFRLCFFIYEVYVGLGRYNDFKLNLFFFFIRFNYLILYCNVNLYFYDI